MFEHVSARAEADNQAAGDLLDAILAGDNERTVRSVQMIVQAFQDVSRRRASWVETQAQERGVAQPAAWGDYTAEHWKSWLSTTALSESDMKDVLSRWKLEFEATAFLQGEILAEYKAAGTREAKKKAHNLRRNAFKVYLKNLYGRPKVACMFLQYPLAMVDTLLDEWKAYMESPEYLDERERSRRDRPQQDKDAEVAMKYKVHRLRHQMRRAKMLERQLQRGSNRLLSSFDQTLFEWYKDGHLARELDEATSLHGYGNLTSGIQLGARR